MDFKSPVIAFEEIRLFKPLGYKSAIFFARFPLRFLKDAQGEVVYGAFAKSGKTCGFTCHKIETDSKMPSLNENFYRSSDVHFIAKELIGKCLFTSIGGVVTAGYITETEAYAGAGDKASHAYLMRRTKRTEVMYAPGGVAYVYRCYGLHWLFNIVTAEQGVPHAVLIRGIKPHLGIEEMMRRRKKTSLKGLADGPATLSEALGIDASFYGQSLVSSKIWVEDHQLAIPPLQELPRVGIAYAEEAALFPWRYKIAAFDLYAKNTAAP
ncbi:MAG: DNA-3-methyladenine glycosylase [Chlamydiales bacterium]|nr:DNA-3-methyladenine glycosylase [Chlamydiales bacterium]